MPKPARKPLPPPIESISRAELVTRMRAELGKFTDIENSVCKVAAERGIFCNGSRNPWRGSRA